MAAAVPMSYTDQVIVSDDVSEFGMGRLKIGLREIDRQETLWRENTTTNLKK